MFVFSEHARRMLRERDILECWVVRALEAPELREPDPTDPSLERIYRRIPEREERVLRVVINKTVDPPRVVSVFFDRRMKGRL